MAKGLTPLDALLADLRLEQDSDLFDEADGYEQEPISTGLVAWAQEYAPKAFTGWVLDAPTLLMLETFEDALTGQDRRVLAVPSPRQGKTTTMIIAMVWSLFRWPHGNPQILIGSNQRNASAIAKKVLTLFKAAGGRLHPKSKSAQEFAPGWRDGMSSTVVIFGRTSPTLGTGGTVWLDDVVASRVDIMSRNYMADTEERLTSDWLSRLQRRPDGSGAALIAIAQRLSSSDLAAVLMRRFGKRPNWDVLHIPTFNVSRADALELYPAAWRVRTIDGAPGEPSTDRFDRQWLEERRLALSPQAFRALMMADTSQDQEVGGFKASYIQEIPANDITPGSLCLAIDAALTAGGDATGWAICGTGAFDQAGKLLILEAGEWRKDPHDLIPLIAAKVEQWKASAVVVERAGGGLPLLQEMQRHWDGFHVAINGVSTRNQSKRMRLEGLLGAMAMGRVITPQGAEWLPRSREQLRLIALERNGADDIGDAIVHGLHQAARWSAGGFTTGLATWGRTSNQRETTAAATWGYGTRAIRN